MAAATWPSSVPSDLVLGHVEGPPGNVAAFAPMVGPPLLYHVGDTRARAVSGRVRISDAERATFRDFFELTLAMGSRPFQLTSDALHGETWLCQFAAEDGYSLEAAPAGWWLSVSLVLVQRLA